MVVEYSGLKPHSPSKPCNHKHWVGCINNSSVLCFCRWECNGTLFLAWPDDWTFCKHEHISWSGIYVCAITCPITVSKSNQIKIIFCFIEDPMCPCSLNKVKDPFGCFPMDFLRLIHEYRSHTYCITNIRSSMFQIQQTANQFPIQCIVYHRWRINFF